MKPFFNNFENKSMQWYTYINAYRYMYGIKSRYINDIRTEICYGWYLKMCCLFINIKYTYINN